INSSFFTKKNPVFSGAERAPGTLPFRARLLDGDARRRRQKQHEEEDAMTKTVTAIFQTRAQAENALIQLDQLGLTQNEVTMLVSDDARKQHFSIEKGSKTEEGALAGASIGGLA